MDSAQFFSQQAATLSSRQHYARGQIASCYALGNLMLARNDVAGCRRLLSQGLNISRQRREQHMAADGWYYLGTSYTLSAADMTRRIECFQQAAALYRTVGDALRAAYCLKTIADLHMQQGKDELARTELLQVLAQYRAVGYRRLHYTYDLLGVTSNNLGDYKEAFRYGQAAIESALATQDTVDLNLFYCRVGALYRALNQFPEALTYYNNVLWRAEKAHNANSVKDALILITELLIAQHQPQRALNLALQKLRQYPSNDPLRIDSLNLLARGYLANQQFGPAESCNVELINALERNRERPGSRGLLLKAYIRAAKIALITKRYDKVRPYLGKAVAQRGETYSDMTEQMLLIYCSRLIRRRATMWLPFAISSATNSSGTLCTTKNEVSS